MIKGIGASPGIAIGKVVIKEDIIQCIPRKKVEDPTKEINRLMNAIEESEEQIQKIYDKVLEEMGKDEAEIFGAHLMMLKDKMLIDDIKTKITNDRMNAEAAVEEAAGKYIDQFNQIDDEYFRERAMDLKDVSGRLIENLLGVKKTDFSNMIEDSIIIATDLAPSDTAGLDKKHVLGFITELGGKTSHSAIMARTLEIPAVVGVQGILGVVNDGDIAIMDGELGQVIINPDISVLESYKVKMQKLQNEKQVYKQYVNKETRTKDNKKIEIAANIGTLADLDRVIENGAEGIGLFRTEFLYMDRNKLPTEEQQYEVYQQLAIKMTNKPVIIRTLDIGGDKDIPYLNMPSEMNPFLGYRAIRLCLDRKDMFITQLKALLRASYYGNIKIMFPMISSMEELIQAKNLLKEAKEILKHEGKPYNDEIEIGMMIEVPSAALLSDLFAKEVDFFSIGTNDLIQYTVAVDRGNTSISHLYNEFNPGVLRLIQLVINNAHQAGIWVGMCGEAASNEKLIPLLLALGLDEFSMNASMIPKSRCIINNIAVEEVKELIALLQWSEASKIEEYLKDYVITSGGTK